MFNTAVNIRYAPYLHSMHLLSSLPMWQCLISCEWDGRCLLTLGVLTWLWQSRQSEKNRPLAVFSERCALVSNTYSTGKEQLRSVRGAEEPQIQVTQMAAIVRTTWTLVWISTIVSSTRIYPPNEGKGRPENIIDSGVELCLATSWDWLIYTVWLSSPHRQLCPSTSPVAGRRLCLDIFPRKMDWICERDCALHHKSSLQYAMLRTPNAASLWETAVLGILKVWKARTFSYKPLWIQQWMNYHK